MCPGRDTIAHNCKLTSNLLEQVSTNNSLNNGKSRAHWIFDSLLPATSDDSFALIACKNLSSFADVRRPCGRAGILRCIQTLLVDKHIQDKWTSGIGKGNPMHMWTFACRYEFYNLLEELEGSLKVMA